MSLRSGFRFGGQTCASLAPGGGADREWLVTDGLGGYAMGTAGGLRTRRYHALLVAPELGGSTGAGLAPRRVGLVALDPTLTLPSGANVPLGVHEWASGAIAPAGHLHLESFELVDGVPRWRWRVGGIVLERELAMVRRTGGRAGSGVAVVHRLIAAPEPVGLTLAALCSWRPADEERTAAGGPPHVEQAADGAVVEAGYRIAGPGWAPAGEWYYGAHTRQEAARGLNPTEDLWHAGTFAARLAPGETLEVCAWTGDLATRPAPAVEVVAAARVRAGRLIAAANPADEVDAQLALAADAFVVDTPAGPDAVAGYPWFGCFPRDTLTGYEGLFLGTGRADEGRALLRGYADRFAESAAPADLDSALWLLHAVGRHVTVTGDTDLGVELVDPLDRLIAGYLSGTPGAGGSAGVWADPADGLLDQDPEPGTLTWMNVRIGRHPVTPRQGKPVDVNALWISGLTALARLRELAGRDATDLRTLHEKAKASFAGRYPTPAGWLYDVVDAPPPAYPRGYSGHYDDPVLRPNQLLAYSLPDPALPALGSRALPVLAATLLTPLGLRTLPPGELGYHGTHQGSVPDRESAYHQGTVWPWLIGPYVDACLAAGTAGSTDGLLDGLVAHLGEYGLGSVSETADGDPPHHASGCPFSARSVAELLRARRAIQSAAPAQSGVPAPRPVKKKSKAHNGPPSP
jgi:predicted glycogen debranching enzyme